MEGTGKGAPEKFLEVAVEGRTREEQMWVRGSQLEAWLWKPPGTCTEWAG